MKLIAIAGLTFLSALAHAQTCKLEMHAPGMFVTSIRTANDPRCVKAYEACENWKAWYFAPANARCYRVQDEGYAVIDYVRYPDYDLYYGYAGSPYYRVARVPMDTVVTTYTTQCSYDRRGRERCRELPATEIVNPRTAVCQETVETCDEYDDGTAECTTVETRVTYRPRTISNPIPSQTTTPTTTPTPNTTTQPMPQPRPNPTSTPTPTTNPTPVPTPNTTPAPTPAPSTDATRTIEAGETVIFNSALQMVVSIPTPNFYNLKPLNGRERDIVKDVARQYVAVTRGCNVGFCANDSVINLATTSYAAIAGLEYDGQFVVKTVDGTNKMSFDMNASSLAWTKGCSPEGSSKVCIGNIVMKQSARNNGYYTVVGIQLDGTVVIENNDGPKKLTLNVRPDSLIITR